MDTNNLIRKYVEEHVSSPVDVQLYDYEINGSIIKVQYSHNPNYEWNKDYTSYSTMEIQLLEYITWIYNQIN